MKNSSLGNRNLPVRAPAALRVLGLCLLLLGMHAGEALSADPASPPSNDGGSLALESLTRGTRLKIAVKPQARCFFGDLDVMYLDSERFGGKGKILLALEALGESGSTPVAVHELQSKDGFDPQAEFELPADLAPGTYALSICSDVRGRGKGCQGARTLPFEQLLEPYQVAVSADRSTVLAGTGLANKIYNDRLYYFSPVLLGSKALRFASKAGSSKPGPEYAKAAQSAGEGAPPSQWAQDHMNSVYSALSSIPLARSGEVLEITLPFFSPEKCGWQAGQGTID